MTDWVRELSDAKTRLDDAVNDYKNRHNLAEQDGCTDTESIRIYCEKLLDAKNEAQRAYNAVFTAKQQAEQQERPTAQPAPAGVTPEQLTAALETLQEEVRALKRSMGGIKAESPSQKLQKCASGSTSPCSKSLEQDSFMKPLISSEPYLPSYTTGSSSRRRVV